MNCSPRGFRNSEFQILSLTNQKSQNQMIVSEKYKRIKNHVVKSRLKYWNLEMKRFSTETIFVILLKTSNSVFLHSTKLIITAKWIGDRSTLNSIKPKLDVRLHVYFCVFTPFLPVLNRKLFCSKQLSGQNR